MNNKKKEPNFYSKLLLKKERKLMNYKLSYKLEKHPIATRKKETLLQSQEIKIEKEDLQQR